jgi:tetratricopeptide (TPR) repeat protein
VRERALGPDALLVADALQELAALHRAEWRLPEAERLYLRALSIRERALGPGDRAVATTLLELERTYLALGDYGQADRMRRRADANGVA